MDRRNFLRFLCVSPAAAVLVPGCKARIKRFDPQPERGLLEGRWPGYNFHTVTARYSLRLQNPHPSLSRPSQVKVPVVSRDGRDIDPGIGLPTVRPTRAVVDFKYDANSARDSGIAVTVYWPIDGPMPIDGSRETDETKTASLEFDDVRRFIDGTGRFRCDDNYHYYGQAESEQQNSLDDYAIKVRCKIFGESLDSRFEGELIYRNAAELFRLAELAVPGIG